MRGPADQLDENAELAGEDPSSFPGGGEHSQLSRERQPGHRRPGRQPGVRRLAPEGTERIPLLIDRQLHRPARLCRTAGKLGPAGHAGIRPGSQRARTPADSDPAADQHRLTAARAGVIWHPGRRRRFRGDAGFPRRRALERVRRTGLSGHSGVALLVVLRLGWKAGSSSWAVTAPGGAATARDPGLLGLGIAPQVTFALVLRRWPRGPGVVGKPLDSAYHPGQRRDWIKVKNVKQQEVIVCGWKPGEGRRADTIGSLLVGIYDGDQLRYAGHVGTGFTQDMLTDLMRQLGSLGREKNPFGTKIPAPVRPRRPVGGTPAGRRGRVRRVDRRRDLAPAELAWAADRQGARRGPPRRLRGRINAGRRSRGCRRSAWPGCGPVSRSWRRSG